MVDETVPAAIRELAATLATPTPMRRGSVSERSMKCGPHRNVGRRNAAASMIGRHGMARTTASRG